MLELDAIIARCKPQSRIEGVASEAEEPSALETLTDQEFVNLRDAIEAEVIRRRGVLVESGGHEHQWVTGKTTPEQNVRICIVPGCGLTENI